MHMHGKAVTSRAYVASAKHMNVACKHQVYNLSRFPAKGACNTRRARGRQLILLDFSMLLLCTMHLSLAMTCGSMSAIGVSPM